MLLLVTTVYQKKITNLVVGELNKNLKSELVVNGKVKLSLFRHFPNATVSLNDVVLGDAFRNLESPLVEVKRVSFVFGFWSLFTDHIKIKTVEFENGIINLMVAKNLGANYNIVKNKISSTDTAATDLKFSIENAILHHVFVRYKDEVSDFELSGMAENSKLSGVFGDDEFDLKIESDLISHKIFFKDTEFPAEKNILLDLVLKVDNKNEEYHFKFGKIMVDHNTFLVEGKITDRDETHLDLSLNCEDGSLNEMISLLPDVYREQIGFLSSNGYFFAHAEINGELSSTKNPGIEIDFALSDGSLELEKIKGELNNVEFEGNFSNGGSHTFSSSSFSVTSFRAELNDQLVKGSLDINNLADPFIILKLDADIDLSKIYPLFGLKNVRSMDGQITVSDFFFSSKMKELKNPNGFKNFLLKGKAELIDVDIETEHEIYRNLNATLFLENNMMMASDFLVEYKNSDFRFNGEIIDLISYLQSLNDSTLLKSVPLKITGDLVSENFVLEEIMAPLLESDESSDGLRDLDRLLNIRVGLSIQINNFHYNKIDATEMTGSFYMSNQTVICNRLKFNTMDGSMILTGDIFISDKGEISSDLFIDAEGIDIENLFYQCENFDQTAITNEHLRGTLNSVFNLKTFVDKQGVWVEDSIYVFGDVTITDGKLLNYSPLYDLSKYIEMSELREINFSKMENTIEVKNRIVFIPLMTIQSSAMILDISGTHSFDNEIDYQIKVNMMQVMARKFKFKKMKEEDYEKTDNGGLNLSITMKGTVDNLEIAYDKVSVKNKLKQDINMEKQELKEVLLNEFKRDYQPENPIEFQKEDEDEELEEIDWD